MMDALLAVAIALPPGARTALRVLVPPAPESTLRSRGLDGARLALGPGGRPLLAAGDQVSDFAAGRRFWLSRGFSDAAAPAGAPLFFASGEDLGFAAPGETATLPFQPLCALPVRGARLFPGDAGALYVEGRAAEGPGREVWVLTPPLRVLRRVLATTQKVAAAAGDGRVTFVAMGRLVARVEGERFEPVFLHPTDEVTGLAYSREGGLFYATATGVGLAGGPEAEFLRAPAPAIQAAGRDLFVLLRGSLAVLEVSDAADLRRPR